MSELVNSLGVKESFLASSLNSNFVLGLADGTLHSDQFNTWLYQDYIFVRLVFPFALATGERIPDSETAYKPLKDAILGNFEVLKKELALFRQRAAANGVILPVVPEVKDTVEEELNAYGGLKLLREIEQRYPQVYNEVSPFNISYVKFLVEVAADPRVSWKYLIALYWIIEQCYRDSFASVINSEKFNHAADQGMKEFVSWWGKNPHFDEFVNILGKSTQQLILDDETNRPLVLDAVRNVLKHEKNFFDGSFGLR
ncbi:phosphomethylpyrimidine kinase (predicted) [Sugiyamaella lignohabitans]|uniref:Phosphomethylpyrimidine kinase (Predicted) n=1 Tax=Sugiyamaella lignohabitans TaxID=796027 RepID=A0A167DUL1_9ASCO|nr:phosphomethylpyrimidine kinase (predicted) [Sugiyamaella lignohabitans]ANB13308.1 phosphomethylpyrimidine kinase (predicted) [Sugiyamaella lignohabitans]